MKRESQASVARRLASAFLGLLLGVSLASACSVPVFRYALERWEPGPYEATVFHRGALTAAQTNLVKLLSGEALSNQPPANLTVTTMGLDAPLSPELAALWKRYETNALPWVVVRFPRGAPAEGVVWSGPLGEGPVRLLLDSPVRKRLARALVKGDSAVWLLLESGDQARDDDAARLLEGRLAQLQKTLKLPEIEAEDSRIVSVPESALRVAFSLLRVSRTDPAEAALVHCLLGTEDDLKDGRETMAFPVFGRGRALCALVGKGITADNIEEASQFLVGPCSCVVKEENPGLDLLLAMDWESQIRYVSTSEHDEPPPLTGLTAALPASNAAPAPAVAAPQKVGFSNPAPSASSPPRTTAVSPLALSLIVLLGIVALVLIGGTFLLRRK